MAIHYTETADVAGRMEDGVARFKPLGSKPRE
jgi:hypothetical protein